MTTAATKFEYIEISTLFLAFELGQRYWKLGFTTGFGQKARERTIAARDLVALEQEIASGRIPPGGPAPTSSCLNSVEVANGLVANTDASATVEAHRRG